MECENMRDAFLSNFTVEKYENFLKTLNSGLPSAIGFRLAESPLFLNDEFCEKLIDAGDGIIDFILRPNFKQLTDKALPEKWRCANENEHPHMIVIDFAVCKGEDGDLIPKLIELQGFPSIHYMCAYHGDVYRSIFDIANDWTMYFNKLDKSQYLQLLKTIILGSCRPDEVVLMDVNPHQQHTAADFYMTQKYLGIPIVAFSDLRQQNKQLFYECQGQLKPIKRIYNRLVFEEINTDPEVFTNNVDLRQNLDVEWITHPNWYYRISKFLLPILEGSSILKSYYLQEIINNIPDDLENYVLKPLFSFGGRNVIIDVTKDHIEKIHNPENWILQQKVEYEPIFTVNDITVKGEIRLMYLWPDHSARPLLATNLVRLSRGNIINTHFGDNSAWTGVSTCFFRKSSSVSITKL